MSQDLIDIRKRFVELFFELEEGVDDIINNKDGYFLMKKLMLTG